MKEIKDYMLSKRFSMIELIFITIVVQELFKWIKG